MSFFTKHQQYYIMIVLGVHPNSIEKLKHTKYDVDGFRANTHKFRRFINEVPNLKLFLEDKNSRNKIGELRLFYVYKAQNAAYVIYSTDRGALNKFYEFLTVISPSNIKPWVYFDISYDATSSSYRIGMFSLWSVLDYKFSSFLVLNKNEYRIANAILDEFMNLQRPKFYRDLISLYSNAYIEDKPYFKFLLLFIIIESLNTADDTSGVVYKIKRLCAVLIGYDEQSCNLVYKKTGEAYNIRSKLVHSGVSKLKDTNLLEFIHSVVCEILISITIFRPKNNTNIFTLVNSMGYSSKTDLIARRELKKYQMLSVNRINIRTIKTKV